MGIQLKVGGRFRSTVCSTEVMVIRAPDGEVDLSCGGAAVEPAGSSTSNGQPRQPFTGGTLIGKRYVNGDGQLELLCVKSGDGSLAVGGEPLLVKGAKPLPSSD